MPQEIIEPQKRTNATDMSAVADHASFSSAERRFRLPVSIALGLVFSFLLILICGVIIAYMAASDRHIAGRLLNQQGAVILKANEEAVRNFFQKQELIFKTLAADSQRLGEKLSEADLVDYQRFLPQGVRLEVQTASQSNFGDTEGPTIAWSDFVYEEGAPFAIKKAEIDLSNGQRVVARYPSTVFAEVAEKMRWDGAERAFFLEGTNSAIFIPSISVENFKSSPDHPLPQLNNLTDTPLHRMWQENARAHTMGGMLKGRVFPAQGKMYTAIYTEIETGPAAGWKIGALYAAREFGAALDQTRVVLYVAIAALALGAILAFLVGRFLGRPLGRLAEAATRMRDLDFEVAKPLPRSRLKELDDVNWAFNSSRGALNAFAKYVPRQLVSRLIEEGKTGSRNIETREMTIVFTDLAGFTELASRMTAEETASYLNDYFEIVSQTVSAHEGTIDKFLGDGVMAFWGAPSIQPDHATLAMNAVKQLSKAIQQSSIGDMRIRIGIHTGEVVVGDIGSLARMNYTVIGDAVNVAARLQEYGKQVDTDAKVIALASGETMQRVVQSDFGENLGLVELRGRTEPITVFRLF